METEIIVLKNGLRIVFQPAAFPVSHACILINAGSRDESNSSFGIAHFIEHLLFKKTSRRSTSQILNCLELVGGDLNAFTTKEYTCIHASFLKSHLSKAIDLFADITFNSVFPEKEIEKEKGVVLDELAAYRDTPEEAIADDFEDFLFQGHGLGHNILGTTESVSSFNREKILNFIQTNYNPANIILGISGQYNLKQVRDLVEKHFLNLENKGLLTPRRPPLQHFKSKVLRIQQAVHQTHTILGGPAFPISHKNRLGLALLTNLLGGMAMSSRLNMEIREKKGIAYNIEAYYSPYQDSGLFSIYFGTDPEKSEKALQLVHKELKKLREHAIGPVLLTQAKRRFFGQIVLAEENRMAVITSMTKSLNDHGYIEHLNELYQKIEDLSAKDLLDIANEVFDPSQLSLLKFEP